MCLFFLSTNGKLLVVSIETPRRLTRGYEARPALTRLSTMVGVYSKYIKKCEHPDDAKNDAGWTTIPSTQGNNNWSASLFVTL